MNFLLIFLCAIVTAVESATFFQDFNEDESKLPVYRGCKPEDRICARTRKTVKDCDIANVRRQCPRLCGMCAPFTPKCPEEYPFGCCWNGDEATDIMKSNCEKCKDRSKICEREQVKKDCNFVLKTAMTRKLCPETCGACRDYGFEPCEDADPRCGKMEDTSCCESSEILRDICRKTCGICA